MSSGGGNYGVPVEQCVVFATVHKRQFHVMRKSTHALHQYVKTAVWEIVPLGTPLLGPANDQRSAPSQI